jgi:uncharacterized protein YbbC (DUF1343 family)
MAYANVAKALRVIHPFRRQFLQNLLLPAAIAPSLAPTLYLRAMNNPAVQKMIVFNVLIAAVIWLGACNPAPVKPTDVPTDNVTRGGGRPVAQTPVQTGAAQLIESRMALLKGKRVAVVANHTSLIHGVHLVDTLKGLGVNVRKVFAPEHGFRGDHDAGKHVSNSKDTKTGIPLVSLYGTNKKPTAAQLADVDIVLFDIQDVGARFYTYISTMSYVMEACAELKKPFVVLDRPNPNGWYVDGPVLKEGYQSFVGMHKVPVAHGMTVGEYAKMVNEEGWLKGGVRCILEVIPCVGYQHSMRWEQTGLPWVAPSPNLPTVHSAYLYPMLCWFEGMAVSIGRGTDEPFEILGAPWHEGYHQSIRRDSFQNAATPSRFQYYGLEAEYIRFTPRAIPHKSMNPDYKDQVCYGVRFVNEVGGKELMMAGIALAKNLEVETHNVKLKEPLFRETFALLTGSNVLEKQVKQQLSDQEIYDSWQADLGKFRAMRLKYLLYPDAK